MTAVPAFYYYVGAQLIPLELVEDRLVVALRDPIPDRRLESLQTGVERLDALALTPYLLRDNLLVYRTAVAARGAERLAAFAGRLREAPTVRYATFVFRNPSSGLYLIPTDEILARFKPEATEAQITALNARHGAEILERKDYASNQMRLRLADAYLGRTLEVANAYHLSQLTEWAEPNFLTEASLAFLTRQWHLENTGQQGGLVGEDARVHAAWNITRGSANIAIAILDTGVDSPDPAVPGDAGHPDLQPNLLSNLGRSFAPSGTDGRPDVDTNSTTAHGTSCAGVAAGVGIRISGAAPLCKLVPLKVINVQTNTAGATSFPMNTDLIADGFRYAAQHAQVLSNSYIADASNALAQAIQDVIATGREGKGTVVLFATHNQNTPMAAHSQARLPGVIAVGASTNNGVRAGYSNFGDAVDDPPTGRKRVSILAPSAGTNSLGIQGNPGLVPDGSTENIYTTDIRGTPGFNPGPPTTTDPAIVPDYTGRFSGTSSATPLAAGICALMLAQNENLTAAQVKYILEATADKIGTGAARVGMPTATVPAGLQASYGAGTGHDARYGFGRINAEQAVKAARGDPVRQIVRDAGGTPAFQDAIPVRLRRVPGTNQFVSVDELEAVDARRDPEAANPAGVARFRAAPGGFLRASFQPAGGGPAITDEMSILGQP